MNELLIRLREAEQRANDAEDAYASDCENEEFENEFDRAYSEQMKVFNEVVDAIVKLTNGKINEQTAGMMLRMRRAELERLVAMM